MLSPLSTGISTAAGVVAGLGLIAGGYSYASLWPSSQIFGRVLIAPPRAGELALTFDDGPNPAWTPRLLDILAQNNVRATFFMVGAFAQSEPALARRVADAGHLIGNHAWSHPNLARTTSARIRVELSRTSDLLAQITGQTIHFFRPPYGARRPAALRIARRLSLTPVTWNAMTSDWVDPSSEHIAAELIKKIDRNHRRGFASNIVLHDGRHSELNANRGPSVTAAGLLLAHYKSTHRFVTLDAWA
ncbi:MAG TPA: polysaccharide deacetylase family protein [Terracidiphilus sp.]|nr:polysaccharide deacetylase family protein [Terracidiphilus sp.]